MTCSFPDIPASGHQQLALTLAAKDWPVFPCGPQKRPAIPKCEACAEAGRRPGSDAYLDCAEGGRVGHGLYDATTDSKRIEGWWTRNPGCIVGVPTGEHVVIDLDTPDGDPDSQASWHAWLALAEPHGWNPADCPLVATPSNGLHIYYRAPAGTDVRNSASKLAPLIDVRGTGGYVIAPGSVLPDGRRYEIIDPDDPWAHSTLGLTDVEIPECPRWLTDLCAPPVTQTVRGPIPSFSGDTRYGTPYGLKALEGELGRLAAAREGTRNEALNKAAYAAAQLAAGGQLDLNYAGQELGGVALRIGLAHGEIDATIRSGMAAGHQHPRRPNDDR